MIQKELISSTLPYLQRHDEFYKTMHEKEAGTAKEKKKYGVGGKKIKKL